MTASRFDDPATSTRQMKRTKGDRSAVLAMPIVRIAIAWRGIQAMGSVGNGKSLVSFLRRLARSMNMISSQIEAMGSGSTRVDR